MGALVVRELDLGMVNGRPYFGVANVGFDGLANEYGNGAGEPRAGLPVTVGIAPGAVKVLVPEGSGAFG